MRIPSRERCLSWIAVAVIVSGTAAFRCTVPGVNEPHYLAKARHFWDPAWCGRDLFLRSANAHFVFYAAVGWLTAAFSFPAAAWVARIAGWLTLAWGWSSLAGRLLPERRLVVVSAVIWTACSAPDGFSGEWIIGGVESKVFAYGLLFAGLSEMLDRRWMPAAAWLGLATAFHPLVGGWGLLACLTPWIKNCLSNRVGTAIPLAASTANPGASSPLPTRSVLHTLLPGALFCLTAAPGIVPAAGMLLDVPSVDVAAQGDRIQVFERLPHHLLPEHFQRNEIVWLGSLLAGCLIAGWLAPRTPAWRRWRGVLLGAVLITLAGLAADLTPWKAALLKFYPFRLLDGLLPCASAVELTATGAACCGVLRRRLPRLAIPMTTTVVLAAAAIPYWWPAFDRVQPRWKPENRAAWLDVCHWIRQETEAESLFLTPKFSFGFKWWAERAEYAVWKDCPQDAASLVEWKRRLRAVQDWRVKHFQRGFGDTALRELGDETGVDYVVAWNKDPFRSQPLYRNPSFSVYRIPQRNGKPDWSAPSSTQRIE